MTDKTKQGRNNKKRGKLYELQVARIMGAERHPADSGGPEDLSHLIYSVQVKSGLGVTTVALREGLDSARAAAVTQNKLGCVVLVERGGPKLRRVICFELEDLAKWEGWQSEI